jgi:AcrR family transcriptional regulator
MVPDDSSVVRSDRDDARPSRESTVSSSAMDAHTAHASGSFVTSEESVRAPSASRQPSDGLGPRAQQTIARILDATRDVFLTRGYSGTTVDEIARVADVSRASFYTYYPSKREVLLTLGAASASESSAVIATLGERPRTRAGMAQFVSDYFDFLDVHGSFSFAWTQAAQEDEEIRVAGMKRHLALCGQLGDLVAQSAGRTSARPVLLGIAGSSLLERSWNYGQLYSDTVDRAAVIEETARAMFAMARTQS